MVMKLRIPAPAWDGGGDPEKEALCHKFKPTSEHDDFFGDGPEASQAEAKNICNGTYTGRVCPQREQCLLFALVNNEHYGVFGGLYALERAYIRRFVPKEDWSFASAPTREQLEEVWPDRIPNNFWDNEDALEAEDAAEDEAAGEDGGSGGDAEGEQPSPW